MWSLAWPALLPLAGCLLTLALGVYAGSRRGTPALSRTLAVFNLAAAAWNLDVFLLFTLHDGALAGRLDRLLQLPIVSIPFLGLLVIVSFLGRRLTHPLLIASGAWTVVLWFVSASPRYLAGWRRFWFGWYGTPGDLYPLFVATLVAYLGVSSALLAHEARATRDHQRRTQAHYLLLANLLLGVASLTNFLPIWGVPVLPLGNLASVAYVGVMAVTIARHRLLDVRALFRAGVLYSTLTFLLSAVYFALVLGFGRWFQEGVFAGSIVLPMLPALALALAVGPLKASVQERLDRGFFRSRAEQRARLAAFSSALARLEREEEIWRAAWEEGWRYAHPERGVVLLCGDGEPLVLREQGTTEAERAGAAALLAGLAGVERLPAGAPFEVAVPVRGREGLLGAALVGPRANGEIWSGEDLAFFEGIAGQAALAVERVRLGEQVRREERLAALGRATAVMAHELRNPLNVIRGAAAVLRGSVGPGEGRQVLGALEAEVGRGERFIADVLAACHVQRPHRCRIDLALCLREFAAGWAVAGAPLELDAPAAGLWVRGNAFQLRQVFENLARNASDALAGRGEGRIVVRAAAVAGAGVTVSVEDEGPGIDPAVLPYLFEPFRTTKNKGTGLGLSIAKGIVEGHGGRIAAANRAGGGAIFRVWLPDDDGEEP